MVTIPSSRLELSTTGRPKRWYLWIELGDLAAICFGGDGDGIGDHHFVESYAGTVEHQVPEGEHAEQPLLLVDHVHVGEVLQLVVETADGLDGLAGAHPDGESCDLGGHYAAGRVRRIGQQLEHLAGELLVEFGDEPAPDIRLDLGEEIGRVGGVHHFQQICGILWRKDLEDVGGQFGPHLLEDFGSLGGWQVGEQLGGCLLTELLEDVGYIVGVGAREGLPFLAVAVEVLLDISGTAARQVEKAGCELSRL